MTARGSYTFDADTAAFNAKVDAASKKAGGIGKRFEEGASGLDRMIKNAAGFVSVSATVLAVWNKIVTTQQEAAEKIKSHAPARQRVLARARSPREAERILGAIEKTRRESGASEEEATALHEKLEGSGMQGDRAAFAKVRTLGANSAEVADSAGNIREIYKEFENGAKILDLIVAGAQSSDATLEAFAKGVADAAPAAQAAGVSLKELIAVMGAVDGQEIETISATLKTLSKSGIKMGAGDFLEMADKMAPMNQRQRQGFLGSKNIDALAGMNSIIEHRPEIREAIAQDTEGALDRQVKIVNSDLRTQAVRVADIARQRKELVQEQQGVRESYNQATVDTGEAEHGYWGWALAKARSYLPYSEEIKQQGNNYEAQQIEQKSILRIQEQIRDYVRPPPPRFRGERVAHPDSEQERR